MRVGKVLLVLVAALVSGVVGYGYATLSNQLAPNRSYDLPADHRTCWDWKRQHVLFFAVDQTRAANNRTELRLSGRATAYDPVSGETFPVEQSDCLTEYFRRANFNGSILVLRRASRSADGRYVAKTARTKRSLIEFIPSARQIPVVGPYLLQQFMHASSLANLALVDEAQGEQVGAIPDSTSASRSEISFVRNAGFVNVTDQRIDWYDLADLRFSHRPWLWGIVTPLVVAMAAWAIAVGVGPVVPADEPKSRLGIEVKCRPFRASPIPGSGPGACAPG